MKNYPEVFNRLDQAYSVWEQELWCLKVFDFYNKNIEKNAFKGGLLPQYDGIKDLYPLTDTETTKAKIRDVLRGENPGILLPGWAPGRHVSVSPFKTFFSGHGISYHLYLPHMLGEWSLSSRRMYYLSEDLHHLINATALSKITMSDIKAPFDSFIINLEVPIPVFNGDYVDCLLVAGMQKEIKVCAFSVGNDSCKPIDSIYRKKVEKAMSHRNMVSFHKLVTSDKFLKKTVSQGQSAYLFVIEEIPDHVLLTEVVLGESVKTERNEVSMFESHVLRIIFGFCMYLKYMQSKSKISLSTDGRIRSNLKPEVLKGGSFLSDAEVFKVQTSAKLTISDREVYRDLSKRGENLSEVSAHFRTGFWHRPRGKGNDPDAPKTEWTQPTIVRRDKLLNGELPLGAGRILT